MAAQAKPSPLALVITGAIVAGIILLLVRACSPSYPALLARCETAISFALSQAGEPAESYVRTSMRYYGTSRGGDGVVVRYAVGGSSRIATCTDLEGDFRFLPGFDPF